MYKRILVPVDGSAGADRALDEAIHLAKEYAAELKVVYVDGVESISRQIIEAAQARARNAGLHAESRLLVKLTTEEIGDVIFAGGRELGRRPDRDGNPWTPRPVPYGARQHCRRRGALGDHAGAAGPQQIMGQVLLAPILIGSA